MHQQGGVVTADCVKGKRTRSVKGWAGANVEGLRSSNRRVRITLHTGSRVP